VSLSLTSTFVAIVTVVVSHRVIAFIVDFVARRVVAIVNGDVFLM
jgi:hypothetical protein